MFDRSVCGVDLGLCERHDVIHFTCPSCHAKHDRGYVNGSDTFRCLGCGYVGLGSPAPPGGPSVRPSEP